MLERVHEWAGENARFQAKRKKKGTKEGKYGKKQKGRWEGKKKMKNNRGKKKKKENE